MFGHDPKGIKSNGIQKPLREIGTEGQGWFPGIGRYKNWGAALPFGLGWKGTLGSTMTFQIEWGARKLWTDYLDDVSGVYVIHDLDTPTDSNLLLWRNFKAILHTTEDDAGAWRGEH